MKEIRIDWEAIRWHAGTLSQWSPREAVNCLPLSEAIWRTKRGENVDLQPSVLHLVNEFQRINVNINRLGDSHTEKWRNDVPVVLAYAVSTLITQFAELATQKSLSFNAKPICSFLWIVSCAWDALLAGDIENLLTHLEVEAVSRGIDFDGIMR